MASPYSFAATVTRRAENGSLPWFSLCGLSKAHSGATAVLVDEFDACLFKGSSYNIKGRAPRLACPGFELMHRYNSDASCIGEFLLAPR